MLLRLAIAQRALRSADEAKEQAQLASAFDIEQQRGDAVHRREQARFLLDVDPHPEAALAAAQQNWQVQREPEDVLVLLRAAQAAHQPQAAEPALQFLKVHRLQDARLDNYLKGNG